MKKDNIINASSQANSDSPIRMVSFHGQELITIEQDDIIYVAMKPICEGMGLDWGGQQKKLVKQMDKFRCRHMSIPIPGGIQKMLCIPLSKLNGWLFSCQSR